MLSRRGWKLSSELVPLGAEPIAKELTHVIRGMMLMGSVKYRGQE